MGATSPLTKTSPNADQPCIGLSSNHSENGPNRELQGNFATLEVTSPSTPQHRLEERVQELEQKLATLSLVLNRRSRNAISPPSITPPISPPRQEDGSKYLALESPDYHELPARTLKGHRNLSFRVLHSPESPDSDKDFSQLADSMFLPDSLPPNPLDGRENVILARRTEGVSPIRKNTAHNFDTRVNDKETVLTNGVEERRSIQENSESLTVEETNPTFSVEKADKVKSKWLEYLNSFQEANYDTDKQMEEFVKIPSAVEALLSYGFWICVDSFLYILTILPIRFVWSSLLLARFLIIRFFKQQVPEGPFRFHRRCVRSQST